MCSGDSGVDGGSGVKMRRYTTGIGDSMGLPPGGGFYYAPEVESELAARDRRNTELEARLRTTAQVLIECVGAVGPTNAEEAAQRAVKRITSLEAENARLRAALEAAERAHPKNDGIGHGGNDWTVPSNDSWAKARIEVQASQLKSQSEEIAKLRAALEASADELKGIANIAVTVTSGRVANAINAVRAIRATAIEAMRACWTALGKEW